MRLSVSQRYRVYALIPVSSGLPRLRRQANSQADKRMPGAAVR